MKVFTFCRAHKALTVFALLALLLVGVAVLAPVLAPMDPLEAHMECPLQPPNSTHPCGTDKLGRDVLSRVLYGTRTSLSAALLLVAVVCVVGTALGMAAGWCGGAVDAILMRLADMMIAFPGLVLAIAIAGLLDPSLLHAVLAIAAVSWPKYARLARSLTLRIKARPYIEAAVLAGGRTGAILRRHVLPNLAATMLVTAATDLGALLLELAGLSFLGFGAAEPTPEWGLMLSGGRTYLTRAPWLMLWPGLAIFVTVAVFNLLGDSLRDLLDPQQAAAVPRRRSKKKGDSPCNFATND